MNLIGSLGLIVAVLANIAELRHSELGSKLHGCIGDWNLHPTKSLILAWLLVLGRPSFLPMDVCYRNCKQKY